MRDIRDYIVLLVFGLMLICAALAWTGGIYETRIFPNPDKTTTVVVTNRLTGYSESYDPTNPMWRLAYQNDAIAQVRSPVCKELFKIIHCK